MEELNSVAYSHCKVEIKKEKLIRFQNVKWICGFDSSTNEIIFNKKLMSSGRHNKNILWYCTVLLWGT